MSVTSNKLKDDLLGMPHGTANGKLAKMILFDLAGRLNLLNCFRCGKRIETLRDLSVEHKQSWMRALDPKESFFDLSNIAYSHLRCNCQASEGRRGRRHTQEHRDKMSALYKANPPKHLKVASAKGRATQAASGNPELKKGHETQSANAKSKLSSQITREEMS